MLLKNKYIDMKSIEVPLDKENLFHNLYYQMRPQSTTIVSSDIKYYSLKIK